MGKIIVLSFTPAKHTVTPSGVIVANYRRAGEVKTGTVGEQLDRLGKELVCRVAIWGVQYSHKHEKERVGNGQERRT